MLELATSFLDQNGMTHTPEGTIPVYKGTDDISKVKRLGGRPSFPDIMGTMEETLSGYKRLINMTTPDMRANITQEKPFFRYD